MLSAFFKKPAPKPTQETPSTPVATTSHAPVAGPSTTKSKASSSASPEVKRLQPKEVTFEKAFRPPVPKPHVHIAPYNAFHPTDVEDDEPATATASPINSVESITLQQVVDEMAAKYPKHLPRYTYTSSPHPTQACRLRVRICGAPEQWSCSEKGSS